MSWATYSISAVNEALNENSLSQGSALWLYLLEKAKKKLHRKLNA
jgi:hypothetical protein